MIIEAAARTHVGLVRRGNEDAFALAPAGASPFWAVVCDGMGGHAAGEVASRIATEILSAGLAGVPGAAEAPGFLEVLAEEANRCILADAEKTPERAGMGTTFVALVADAAGALTIAHAGDSRAYRLRAGALERLTEDHTVANDLVRAGLVSAADAPRVRQGAALTRVLGMEEYPGPEIIASDIAVGDVYLLCSDGLTNAAADDAIEAALAAAPAEGCAASADRLVAAVLQAGAPDNVTVVVVVVRAA